MTTISFHAARRTLVRFLSASAVRIALGATLATPQPVVAAVPPAASRVSHVEPTQHADVDSGAARTQQTPADGGAGFGPGWG